QAHQCRQAPLPCAGSHQQRDHLRRLLALELHVIHHAAGDAIAVLELVMEEVAHDIEARTRAHPFPPCVMISSGNAATAATVSSTRQTHPTVWASQPLACAPMMRRSRATMSTGK